MFRQEACVPGWAAPMNGERAVTTDEDGSLVARFLRGEAGAFDALFQKYQDYVYHIIYGIVGSSEEARDLTQDVFVQVYRALPKFRHGARFATWLYRIAANRAVDAARGSRRWRFLPILEDAPPRSEETIVDPEKVVMRGAEQTAVQQVLMKCPLGHREVLALRYYQELSLEEISEVLGCSVSAAKVRLHRARKVFKDAYIAMHGSEIAERALREEETDAAATLR
jgi:RNA polymerase sigma-70 factor, ECF subfamily